MKKFNIMDKKSKYPKIMEVSDYADFKTFKTRVVIAYKQDVYVAWSFAETFEDAEISLLFRQGNPLVTKCRWEELPFSFG